MSNEGLWIDTIFYPCQISLEDTFKWRKGNEQTKDVDIRVENIKSQQVVVTQRIQRITHYGRQRVTSLSLSELDFCSFYDNDMSPCYGDISISFPLHKKCKSREGDL
jgi:hypothetical protein